MAFIFPTEIHRIAFKHYDHFPRARNDAEFILWKMNEDNLEDYVEIFLNSIVNLLVSILLVSNLIITIIKER